jgi:hypothetical protein
LSGCFAEFIREKNLDEIVISTDDGLTYVFSAVMKTDPLRTELGCHWNMLCENNKFKVGDVVCFKFDKDLRCHVYKSNY